MLRTTRPPSSLIWVTCLLATVKGSSLDLMPPPSRLTSECPVGFRGKLNSAGFAECALPTDDSAGDEPERWAPWTHRPYCLKSSKDPETKYCVYTNVHYGDNGISLITTPEHAASSLYLLEDPNLPLERITRQQQQGLGWFSTNTTTTTVAVEAPPYEIVDIPGKGKGVVATRRIKRFEMFMLESAVIATDIQFPSSVKRLDGYKLLHEAVNRLKDPDKVLSLARSNPFAADVVEDVLRTNSFAGELDGAPHMALFPRISRMNHACKPNAFTRYSRRAMVTAVLAAYDIKPGEEITISYAALGLHFQERQSVLKNTWGFTCTCATCSQPESVRSVSDQRRKDVQQKRKDVVAAIDKADAATAIRLSNEVLDLLASEDLPALFAEQYEILARVYWAVGYAEKAVKYAKMALKVMDMFGDLDPDEEYANLEALLASFVSAKEPAMGRPTREDREKESRRGAE